MAFGSNADAGDYHGWIMGYNASNLAQQYALNITPHDTGTTATEEPDVQGGGIWQSGTGLSSDGTYVYAVIGNGTFNATTCSPPTTYCNYGSSIIRLNTSLQVQTYFTPSDYVHLNDLDLDLGIDAAIFIPGTNRLITGSKEGIMYVVDRTTMGGFHPPQPPAPPDDPQIVQEFCYIGPTLNDCRNSNFTQHMHSAPIFWDGPGGLTLYVWSENAVPRAFHYNTSTNLFDTTPVSLGTVSTNGMPSGILSLSANGSAAGTGIVWGTRTPDPTGDKHGVLYAFDAADLSHVLWNSDSKPADAVGMVAKFNPPMVANGKVYLASFSDKLVVYGLIVPDSPPAAAAVRNYYTSQPISLRWSRVDWAASYEIQVDDSAVFGSPLPSPSTVPAPSLTATVTVPANGVYYWRVRAKRADGYTGAWSAVQSFTLNQ
jgi:hypothetical protein